MEAPIGSDSEDGSDESIVILPEDLEEEVDINVHFHCEHCFKISKCREMSKPGWSCPIIECSHGCGFKFHACKTEEHELLCSHMKVPCLNQKNGCPYILPRRNISQHLSVCPASIVICNVEWNRWALGAREREKVAPCSGYTSLYDSNDFDISFALEDQKLVNELHSESKNLRRILCNGITRRFPSLPLTVRGTYRHAGKIESERKAKSQSTTDDDEDPLTPGLSLSVCTSLLRESKSPRSDRGHCLKNGHSIDVDRKTVDDISAYCCVHGIMKDMCHFCRNDPDEPNYKIAHVWREKLGFNTPGKVNWAKEPRVEKVRTRGPLGTFVYKQVDESDDEDKELICKRPTKIDSNSSTSGILKRFRTPSPVPLSAKALNVELVLKDYSRHQTKPQAMFTFQCMQEMRRDHYCSHYQNVHSEILEGLDGWIMERCPLHIFGCPFSVVRMHPYEKGNLRFSSQLKSFGVTCTEVEFPKKIANPLSRASSVEKSPILESTEGLDSISELSDTYRKLPHVEDAADGGTTELNLLMLPVEILEKIATNLDAFTLNSLSMTCKLLREVAFSLLYEKGLVIQEWIQSTADDGTVRWRNGYNRWFFPKTFCFVDHWRFSNLGCVANHLAQCPFNIRQRSEKKFCYTEGCSDRASQQMEKLTRGCS